MVLVELIDVVCPNCRAVNAYISPGSYTGVHCRRCKVDFVAYAQGRTLIVRYGQPTQRKKPCDIVIQEEPLLPKAYRPEPAMPIIPVPGLVVDG